jgi:hypothetical protein
MNHMQKEIDRLLRLLVIAFWLVIGTVCLGWLGAIVVAGYAYLKSQDRYEDEPDDTELTDEDDDDTYGGYRPWHQ